MSVQTISSLHDDWQVRRKRLDSVAGPVAAFARSQARVLDYLIQRYSGSTVALQPARFPAPGELFLDRRAILVFHRLGAAKFSGVKTEQEATRRASVILKRLSNLNLQQSAESYTQSGAIAKDRDSAPLPVMKHSVPLPEQFKVWEKMRYEIANRNDERQWPVLQELAIEALSHGSMLPEQAVSYFAGHLHLPGAVEILSQSMNESVPDLLLNKWREWISERRLAHPNFIRVFSASKHRTALADKIRLELLCSDTPRLRCEAARMLGRIGTIDDVSLLGDLLLLPYWKNEALNERVLMMRAMRRISHSDCLSHERIGWIVDRAVHHVFAGLKIA